MIRAMVEPVIRTITGLSAEKFSGISTAAEKTRVTFISSWRSLAHTAAARKKDGAASPACAALRAEGFPDIGARAAIEASEPLLRKVRRLMVNDFDFIWFCLSVLFYGS